MRDPVTNPQPGDELSLQGWVFVVERRYPREVVMRDPVNRKHRLALSQWERLSRQLTQEQIDADPEA